MHHATTAAHAVAATGHHEPPGEHTVRDRDRAQFWQDYIRTTVLNRYPDLESAIAAGYAPTRTDIDGPVHYTLGGYTDPDPANPDGGTTDLSRPFSLVVEDGRIVGVMLRAPEGEVDLGAGEWHAHAEDASGAPLMHVWFDKPLDEAFGGHLPGFNPGDPMPLPEKPSPKPPVPKPPVPKPEPAPLPEPEPAPLPEPVPFPFPPITPGHGCGCAPLPVDKDLTRPHQH
jgi:hypothetical protein